MSQAGVTWGAVLCGFIVCTALYGITCGQFLCYFHKYHHDRLVWKWTVAMVLVLDTLQECLACHSMWHYLVARCYGNEGAYNYAVWSLSAQMIPTEILCTVAHLFYIQRLYKFKKQRCALILLVPVSLCAATSIVYVTRSLLSPAFEGNDDVLSTSSKLLALFTISTDLGIAASTCYVLYVSREHAQSINRSVVTRLIRYSVVAGVMMFAASFTFLIVYVAFPHTFLYIGMYFIAGKVYVNCMLAALNSRDGLRREIYDVQYI